MESRSKTNVDFNNPGLILIQWDNQTELRYFLSEILMINLQIATLISQEAQELSDLILSDRPDYRQYFTPFSFETQDLAHRLATAQGDRYWSIRVQEALTGFFHVARL